MFTQGYAVMSSSPQRSSPIQPVLVPVDFEPPARAALVFGARMAMSTNAPLKILHVVHEPANKPNYYHRDAQRSISIPMDELARRMLDAFVSEVRRDNPELTILEAPETLLVAGLPCTRIPEVAALVDAGQVVIGQHRVRSLFGGLFAPGSERIANRCNVPVTVVYTDIPGEEIPHARQPAVRGPHFGAQGQGAVS